MGDYSYSEHLDMFGGPPEPGEAYPDLEQVDLARKAQKEDPPQHPLIGKRVKLLACSDPYTRLLPGALGTVRFVDSMGTVHVNWDDGSSLGLIAEDGDRWTVVDEQ